MKTRTRGTNRGTWSHFILAIRHLFWHNSVLMRLGWWRESQRNPKKAEQWTRTYHVIMAVAMHDGNVVINKWYHANPDIVPTIGVAILSFVSLIVKGFNHETNLKATVTDPWIGIWWTFHNNSSFIMGKQIAFRYYTSSNAICGRCNSTPLYLQIEAFIWLTNLYLHVQFNWYELNKQPSITIKISPEA